MPFLWGSQEEASILEILLLSPRGTIKTKVFKVLLRPINSYINPIAPSWLLVCLITTRNTISSQRKWILSSRWWVSQIVALFHFCKIWGLKSRNGEQRPGPIKNTHAVSSQYNKLIAVYLFSMATPTTLRRDPSIGDPSLDLLSTHTHSYFPSLFLTAFTLKACTRYIEGHYVKGNRCIK